MMELRGDFMSWVTVSMSFSRLCSNRSVYVFAASSSRLYRWLCVMSLIIRTTKKTTSTQAMIAIQDIVLVRWCVVICCCSKRIIVFSSSSFSRSFSTRLRRSVMCWPLWITISSRRETSASISSFCCWYWLHESRITFINVSVLLFVVTILSVSTMRWRVVSTFRMESLFVRNNPFLSRMI